MSAIAGLSTNILKYICTIDINSILSSSEQMERYNSGLSNASSVDVIALLLNQLDPTLTNSFLRELDETLIDNTRILLLEGVNAKYNAYHALETLKGLLAYASSFYTNDASDSGALISVKLERCSKQVEDMLTYLHKYVNLEVPGETLADKEYHILENFKEHSKVVEELSNIYTSSVARVYAFQLAAKKSFKYPNSDSDTIKHSFVIPQDFREVLECDISLKYITMVASLLEYSSPSSTRTLLHLFTSIERLSVTTVSELLGISLDEARNLALDEYRLAMYNTVLVTAMHVFAINNPYYKDILNIPEGQLRQHEDPLVGYNLETFVVHNSDLLQIEEVAPVLANWWRYYAYYQYILTTHTDLLGISPEMHRDLGYTHRKVQVQYPDGTTGFEDRTVPFNPMTKFKSLLQFTHTMLGHAKQNGFVAPSAPNCNTLLNHMISALSQGQYGTRQDINYSATCIKPADVIITEFTSKVTQFKTNITEVIHTIVEGGSVSTEVHQTMSSILPWINVLEQIVTATDHTLVPQYTHEWANVNSLGIDMNNICVDRNAMLFSREVIKNVYDRNEYRINVFDDKQFGVQQGMTIYAHSKAREPETLLNCVVTTVDNVKVPSVHQTHAYVANALTEVKYITDVLEERLRLINQYEDDSSSNITFKALKSLYKRIITYILSELNTNSTILWDAITFHYGHSELNKNLKDFKQRESKLEPIKIEQSRSKSMLEGTIDRHKSWYSKLEAREFMLSCLETEGLDADYMKTPVW